MANTTYLHKLFAQQDPLKVAACKVVAAICESVPAFQVDKNAKDSPQTHIIKAMDEYIAFYDRNGTSPTGSKNESVIAATAFVDAQKVSDTNTSYKALDALQSKIYERLKTQSECGGLPVTITLQQDHHPEPDWLEGIVLDLMSKENMYLYDILPLGLKLSFIVFEDGEVLFSRETYKQHKAPLVIQGLTPSC